MSLISQRQLAAVCNTAFFQNWRLTAPQLYKTLYFLNKQETQHTARIAEIADQPDMKVGCPDCAQSDFQTLKRFECKLFTFCHKVSHAKSLQEYHLRALPGERGVASITCCQPFISPTHRHGFQEWCCPSVQVCTLCFQYKNVLSKKRHAFCRPSLFSKCYLAGNGLAAAVKGPTQRRATVEAARIRHVLVRPSLIVISFMSGQPSTLRTQIITYVSTPKCECAILMRPANLYTKGVELPWSCCMRPLPNTTNNINITFIISLFLSFCMTCGGIGSNHPCAYLSYWQKFLLPTLPQHDFTSKLGCLFFRSLLCPTHASLHKLAARHTADCDVCSANMVHPIPE